TELFLLWLAVLGFANFLGYLMTGPVFTDGDIGKVFDTAGTAVWVRIVLAVVGAGLLLFIAYKMTRPFLEFSPRAEWLDNGASRKKFSLHSLILPWLIGSALITLLYLPVIAIVSIIYPVMRGMVFIFPWQNAVNAKGITPALNARIERPSAAALILLVVVAGVSRLTLAPGIHLKRPTVTHYTSKTRLCRRLPEEFFGGSEKGPRHSSRHHPKGDPGRRGIHQLRHSRVPHKRHVCGVLCRI